MLLASVRMRGNEGRMKHASQCAPGAARCRARQPRVRPARFARAGAPCAAAAGVITGPVWLEAAAEVIRGTV